MQTPQYKQQQTTDMQSCGRQTLDLHNQQQDQRYRYVLDEIGLNAQGRLSPPCRHLRPKTYEENKIREDDRKETVQSRIYCRYGQGP